MVVGHLCQITLCLIMTGTSVMTYLSVSEVLVDDATVMTVDGPSNRLFDGPSRRPNDSCHTYK